ncbi:UPF0182 family protein [Candidatus Uabimicrobium sp. HlEnr_7]|uniref:UPF0182 family protein n=1 Tax=Candidatus Uabimicrobium helgolandensis TaxID=3095367 RepID=UPI0035560830
MSKSTQEYEYSSFFKKNLGKGLTLSYALGFILIFLLIQNAGFWNVASNTRVLDLLIDAGIVQYTDKDAGIVEGVSHLKYYMYSQDPVKWNMIFVVIAMFFSIWGLRAIQFSVAARFHGSKKTLGEHSRAFFYGMTINNLFPFEFGRMAKASSLEPDSQTYKISAATIFTTRLFILFEIVLFGAISLFFMGWGNWAHQLFWALLIAFVAYKVTYGRGHSLLQNYTNSFKKVAHLLSKNGGIFFKLSTLSILAFALEDLAAYFCAQAFTSSNIILNVDFDILLMALVAGNIARFFRITPGGIGQFEWAFAATLYVGGLGFPEAATIAIFDSFFRYSTLFVIFLITKLRYNSTTSYSSFTESFDTHRQIVADKKQKGKDKNDLDIPSNYLTMWPEALTFSRRLLTIAFVALGVFFFDQLTILFMDKWLMESLQLSSVFWTNFNVGSVLFLLAAVPCAAGIILPAYKCGLSDSAKKLVVMIGTFCGLIGGYLVAIECHEFLPLFYGLDADKVDSVFGNDIGFYLNCLPGIWIAWKAIVVATTLGLLSSICCSYISNNDVKETGLNGFVAKASSGITLFNVAIIGVVLGIGEWLTRYDLLVKDNSDSAVHNGAEYIDIVGLFSNLSYIWITSVAIIAGTFVAIKFLKTFSAGSGKWQGETKDNCLKLVKIMIYIIILDFGFKGVVVTRDALFVKPNEPVVQLDYIKRHVDATLRGYQLHKIEDVNFSPSQPGDPLPKLEDMLADPAIQNAPLWPGYVSYLETLTDPQHSKRILQTGGDTMVYGPTLEIMRQEQKLRTYYNFLNVDTVRYKIGNEKKMFVSALRELPLLEPQQWLAWWGQQFVLFTHGHGMVMLPSGEAVEGNPNYVSKNIPTTADWSELKVTRPEIYYGEGSATMAYVNVKDMKEFDYPTEQGRAEVELPKDVKSGVVIDSIWKKMVIGWRSSQFVDILFSSLIEDKTRVIYSRRPIERLERIAPFLHYDTNSYAVNADGRITWVLNAMTTSDLFPYSKREYLGDKSVERTYDKRPTKRVNYVEDSVKATIDAYTGAVRFYKFADSPIINTWANIYPELFANKKDIPKAVQPHLSYPLHLFHVQFDDIYNIYHMKDKMTFFNMEDMWDDCDEVLGPIIDKGKSITFSMEPYNCILQTGGVLPKSKEGSQYVMTMAFTPEKAMNLRSIPVVYQDGEDYGRLFSLQIPKGVYTISPEQADAMIDQDPEISQKFSLWNRRGAQVIRGHTSLLIVGNEVLYIEPVFIRSEQSSATQMKKVIVVFRGKPFMGNTLKEAMTMALGQAESR